MATRLTTVQRNAHANLGAAAVDAGPAAGYVAVRTGAQPATANDAATGTLLVTITLADPAYAAAAAGVAALNVSPAPSAVAVAAGTPGWFRVFDSTGTSVRDGSLTGAAAVSVGGTVDIAVGSLTMPATT